MTEPGSTLESALQSLLRRIVREELGFLPKQHGSRTANPTGVRDGAQDSFLSWVYEQSRQKNHIPTRRLGRYIRFNLQEVIESQKQKT